MFFKKKKEEKILPITPKEFDLLIDEICEKFGFKDKNHASAVVSVAIRHLPNDQPKSSVQYLAGCIHKSLANHVAHHKGQMAGHEAQINILENKLKDNPNDQQAFDEIVKAANDGSELAKAALSRIEGSQKTVKKPCEVVQLNAGKKEATSERH